jgi:ADP-heptose:LPS heptosyltransferase
MGYPTIGRRRYAGLGAIIPFYGAYDAVSDRDLMGKRHIIEVMCRTAGITGEIELRPYIYLSETEKNNGRLLPNQAVIQSCGLRAAAAAMKNKEWYPERFQEVVDQLQGEVSFVQLGNAEDPALRGVTDLRGKTTLRESAAILASSMFFAGQVGFLMHLARAVDCRSAIVYGGREDPCVTGYRCNVNLTGTTPCAPCWQRNRCDHDKECMRQITADAVIAACRILIRNSCYPLDRECTVIEGS